ncbi:MAG: hypothetical protein KJ706_05225 [Candidatus Omnitrophica bacterium]|nr:hypothetical protein [Candidatus Omnitrophota bacterium]
MVKMKEEAKKKWGGPKLIVLIRGKHAESVLLFCKDVWENGAEGDDCRTSDNSNWCSGLSES